ncbi:MAG: SDR family NAD(P)-dependent oxidoreductase [Polyangiaceae bacterium]|nr:SDR family NAD(P)-dependent oxidoreductase [Polyangiaceae bacterium]
MKAVVLGGTTGIGRALAQRLAARGDAVFLMGLDEADLARSASDLKSRSAGQTRQTGQTRQGGGNVGYAVCNLEKPEGFVAALDAADAALNNFDTVIVTAAMYATQEALEADIELTQRLVTVNYANTVVFCEHVRKRLLSRGGGWLTVFSSVAGDRGRKPVGIYGSSKAGIARYLEALDHKYHTGGLSVLCVKPGFVKTGMTAGLKPPPFAGDPDQVADDVLRAMDARKPILYTPHVWALVMMGIRHLPRFVMRKISF